MHTYIHVPMYICVYELSFFPIREIYKRLPEAGSLIAYDPVSRKDKYEEIEQPFRKHCCIGHTDCGPFSTLRPVNDGKEYNPPKSGNK